MALGVAAVLRSLPFFSDLAKKQSSLADLANISILLSEELRKVGISTPQELYRVGSEAAWLRLRKARIYHDVHILLGLEGAIQGVKWQSLSGERRAELLRHAEQS